ncbi:MAG TPA: hypothetical protein VGO52_25305 [Hyphomonadaceae bacterium]|jgi:hypothetical protein|nr:hypothetical protein [Hyphomonadaceae bacterium]
MRQLALILGGWAARLMHPVRPTQALAMYAEIENLPDRAALVWALGCLAAACRLRASLLAALIVGARLCVALAAGLFGYVHVWSSTHNLWFKLQIMSGVSPKLPASFINGLNSQPIDHWVWICVMFSTLGILHLIAAAMMALGRNDKVLQLSVVVIGLDLLMSVAGLGGLTLSAIYIGLITLMALVSAGLAWLWRWDERRMALT